MRSFMKGRYIKQASFHTNFDDKGHHGMSDCKTILIDQTDAAANLRTKSFW